MAAWLRLILLLLYLLVLLLRKNVMWSVLGRCVDLFLLEVERQRRKGGDWGWYSLWLQREAVALDFVMSL